MNLVTRPDLNSTFLRYSMRRMHTIPFRKILPRDLRS